MNKKPILQRLNIAIPAAMLMLGLSISAARSDTAVAQIASPTPTGSQIQLPTSTATQVGGPTATPSRTPSIAPVMAEVIEQANLRTVPSIGDDSDIVATLEGGTTLPVIGRWIGYDWLLVAWTEAPGGQAWIHQSVVTIIGDLTTVPAVTPMPQATIEPTQAILNATATVLLQTPGGAETATAAAFSVPSGVYTVTPGNPALGGALPTFTPPEPYIQPETLPPPTGSTQSRRGPAPAVMIIALGAMGLLTLAVGLLRRL
ncbi:MAG: SH3 domain-containing protein [Anaerolineae bacterium]|nr:SH3 domain-containing protein [Anaerolineae bacterium]